MSALRLQQFGGMRNALFILASSMALVFAGCNRDPNEGTQPQPAPNYGGGPASDHVQGGSANNTFDGQGAQPAPSGSAAHELPGMPPGNAAPQTELRNDGAGGLPGQANESNGGSGAGATGTKGEGMTLHNGLNDQGAKRRPNQGQKKVDLGPGKP
jgi:hypothetical protein